jgi:hypothetical protein
MPLDAGTPRGTRRGPLRQRLLGADLLVGGVGEPHDGPERVDRAADRLPHDGGAGLRRVGQLGRTRRAAG